MKTQVLATTWHRLRAQAHQQNSSLSKIFPLFRLHGALQRVLMFLGIRQHLTHLGFRNVTDVNPAYPYSLLMHMHHDAGRIFPALDEKPFQNNYDELHWSI